ncbi:MAG: nucleotidyl transferase AbiEii/AbiGii toxin family protein [Myxococcaceae bacterium]|nr:nucleotidyl transferase AbiEii/AbiGii toxin family protein [Myxococcaceae bacterium]
MNLPESVKQRLKNIATHRGYDINSIFQYYLMERFLYRISKSPDAQCLVLKGALMLRTLSRATRDKGLLLYPLPFFHVRWNGCSTRT